MIAKSMLAEFEQEALTTRRFLERLPEDNLAWRPHEKSMTIGGLGLHIAQVPGAIVELAREDEIEAPDFGVPQPGSVKQILDAFEASIATVRELLPGFDEERMHGTWKMTAGGKTLLALPRVALFRSVLLNHWYHHRGQLSVYFRLLNLSVPSAYGPSADEAPFGS